MKNSQYAAVMAANVELKRAYEALVAAEEALLGAGLGEHWTGAINEARVDVDSVSYDFSTIVDKCGMIHVPTMGESGLTYVRLTDMNG